jgi:D-alanyl-D-alanine-carboxypeptidase/D-alanyl-D-alanine-endopeptidase
MTFIAASTLAHAKPPADLQARIDAFAKGQTGGIAIAWVDADGPQFFQAGTFSGTDPRPVTADTEFEMGSVTKVFNALLLAESERMGKVSRLDPAAKFLLPAGDPDQAKLAGITLLSLTTHTSGLPRLPSNIGRGADHNPDPYALYDRAMLVEAFRADGAAAPANSLVAYSNFGAGVLGEALAAAWGTTYVESLTTHVLAPLGMHATSLGVAGQPAPLDLAPGNAGGATVPNWTFLAMAPAGALRSSARDMAIFLAACLGAPDGPMRASIDATLRPEYPTEDLPGHIGMGWFLLDDPAHPVAWHNGATAGSHAFVAFDRKLGAGIAVMSNFQKPSEALGFGLLGAKPPQPKAKFVENATSYVGRYPLSPSFAIDITSSAGGLRGQATGQALFGMRETARDQFAIIGIPAAISFERDSAGGIVALVLHQNGRDMRGPRGDLPPPPKVVTLPAQNLLEYAGDYALSPAFILTVTDENGVLQAQATGQSKFPLFASADDQFFAKVAAIQITFQRDASGKVIGLVLHQNGQDVPAKKSLQ